MISILTAYAFSRVSDVVILIKHKDTTIIIRYNKYSYKSYIIDSVKNHRIHNISEFRP